MSDLVEKKKKEYRGNPNLAEWTKENKDTRVHRGQFTSIIDEVKMRMYSDEEEWLEIDGAQLCGKNWKPELNGNGKPKEVRVRIKLPRREAFILHYIGRFFKNDKMAIDLMNRIEGYPTQKIEKTERSQKVVQIIRGGNNTDSPSG